ncbi:MAG: putative rane protein [Rhodocyclales bacterium]|nr:putative rane protein [Rhodocyclales bacterium]
MKLRCPASRSDMSFSSDICRFLRALLFSVLAISAALWLSWPRFSVQALVAHDPSSKPALPWVFHSIGDDNQLSVGLDVSWLTPRSWLIKPDDDLRKIVINGNSIPLDGVRPGGLQDYTNGFVIDLSPYLAKGHNEIVFFVDNHGGDGGLDMRPMLGAWRWSLIGIGFLPLLFGLARLFRLRGTQTAVLCLALVVLCCYWSATPWNVRTHDVSNGDGHFDYIVYVATHLALPNPMQGWTFYHPPAYYMLGAVVYRWAQWLSLPAAESMQALSLALWLVFLAASAGTLRLVLRNRHGALIVATIAVAFWPSGIIHGLRIGNDAALYASVAIATWFMIRWWRARRRTDLWAFATVTALSLLCKSNATVLLGAGGILVLSTLLSTLFRHKAYKRRRAFVDLAIFSGVAGCGLALSFAVRIYYYLRGDISNWLIANVGGLSSGLRVPVDIKSFLPLDIPTFLTVPWMDPGNDASGRANFWNYLLRSSLSGEFSFDGALHRTLAILWGIVLLALCWVALDRFAHDMKRGMGRDLYRQRPWLLLSIFWLASLLALRIQLPFSCSNDFRYVLPILVPAALYWASGGRVARILVMLMALLSALFFVSL